MRSKFVLFFETFTQLFRRWPSFSVEIFFLALLRIKIFLPLKINTKCKYSCYFLSSKFHLYVCVGVLNFLFLSISICFRI